MGFNLTTFLAQIVNLFLLIWLLKRFLYRPVLAIIEKRQHQIKQNMQEAEEKLAHAEQTQNNLLKLQDEFEANRQKRLSDLEQEIDQQRTLLAQELAKEFQTKQQKLQDNLDLLWAQSQLHIQHMIGAEFMALTKKILGEWSHQNPIDQLLLVFEKKLRSLPKAKHKLLQKTLLQQKNLLVITSSILHPTQKAALKKILQKYFTFPGKIRFQYKHQADLILGIEIRIGDFSLDWNLNTYLQEINQNIKHNISSLIVSTQRKANK